MNLVIDIGNTFGKLTVMDGGGVVGSYRLGGVSVFDLEKVFAEHSGISGAIMSGLDGEAGELDVYLGGRLKDNYIRFSPAVAVPIRNLYKTPETLGPDRLAAAVGATVVYPGSDVLVFDFGTAVTIDFVSAEGEFLGGNISPGAGARFRALNQFTKTLPLCSLREDGIKFMGDSSGSAIESGVVNGMVYEIEGYISDFMKKYPDLRIIFTGGDGEFFAKRLKNTIFATYDLVAYGLNRILEYNAE